MCHVVFPGSTRSGENARLKSLPATRPVDSKIGFTNSTVVPGYVVDCRITNMSLRSADATVWVADWMKERSGVLALSNGVGTQMNTTSAVARSCAADVARNFFAPRIAATRSLEMSSMWLVPAFSLSTVLVEMSNPIVGNPTSANATTSGRPTYPRPTTATVVSRLSTR